MVVEHFAAWNSTSCGWRGGGEQAMMEQLVGPAAPLPARQQSSTTQDAAAQQQRQHSSSSPPGATTRTHVVVWWRNS